MVLSNLIDISLPSSLTYISGVEGHSRSNKLILAKSAVKIIRILDLAKISVSPRQEVKMINHMVSAEMVVTDPGKSDVQRAIFNNHFTPHAMMVRGHSAKPNGIRANESMTIGIIRIPEIGTERALAKTL